MLAHFAQTKIPPNEGLAIEYNWKLPPGWRNIDGKFN